MRRGTRRATAWLSFAVVGTAVTLSACADPSAKGGPAGLQPTADSAQYFGNALDLAGSVAAVTDACPRVAFERLQKETVAGQVHICTTATRRVPGDGEWIFAQVRRATAGLELLFAAYAARDAKPTDGACTADLPDPRVVWLHPSPIRAVRAPRDACGKPTRDASAAYDALATEVVSEVPVRRLQSEVAFSSGCSQQWKDMLALGAAGVPTADPTGVPVALKGAVRLCRYTVLSDPQGDRGGDLVSGVTLDVDRIAAINAALARSVPDASCRSADHHGFAVLLPSEGTEIYVALDGCAVHQGSNWWRAAADLAPLLL